MKILFNLGDTGNLVRIDIVDILENIMEDARYKIGYVDNRFAFVTCYEDEKTTVSVIEDKDIPVMDFEPHTFVADLSDYRPLRRLAKYA